MLRSLFFLMIVAALCVGAAAQSPTIVAQVSLTNQAAPIPKTTLVTPSADALYRVTAYFVVTKTNRSGTLWHLTLGWEGDGGTKATDVTIASNPNEGYPTWVSWTVSPGDKAGFPLTYQVGPTGTIANPYNLFITVEQLQ